jgi:CheY-like chemotaxis protein
LIFNREKANYKVYVANNGVEALAVIDENPELDACLLDVEMPVMDGREAMYAFAPCFLMMLKLGITNSKRIRAKEQANGTRRLPVCAITGNARQAQLDDLMALGMDRALTKPYSFQQVLEFITHEDPHPASTPASPQI